MTTHRRVVPARRPDAALTPDCFATHDVDRPGPAAGQADIGKRVVRVAG